MSTSRCRAEFKLMLPVEIALLLGCDFLLGYDPLACEPITFRSRLVPTRRGRFARRRRLEQGRIETLHRRPQPHAAIIEI